ncbi:MAG: DUF4861 family protein [Prevotella sp.]|nr:DUF4861 family protein [Prevotella sp.]
MKRIVAMLAMAMVLIPASAITRKKVKRYQPILTTQQVIEKVNDHWQQTQKPEANATWDNAFYQTANMAAYQLLGHARWLEYSDKWARHNQWGAVVEPGICPASFQTYLELNAMNPADHKVSRVKASAGTVCAQSVDGFWQQPEAPYRLMPLMARLAQLTGDAQYWEKMYQLYQRSDGKRDTAQILTSAWELAALAQVLPVLPADEAHRADLLRRFQQLAVAVAARQEADGTWTVNAGVQDQTYSQTALLCYALLRGVNFGLLQKTAYFNAIEPAWSFLLSAQAQQEDGTSVSTGAFLLAACERMRYEDAKDAKELTVVVHNDADEFRQEIVELDAPTVFRKMQISGGRQFQVWNALGQEVAYQLTHDGKILIEAAIRPCGSATFTLKYGIPRTVVNTSYGRMYPERVDDIAWENDRGAYRLYGPALQQSGERAFGNDVWVKNTPDLEVERRYYIEDINKPQIAQLKAAGKDAEAHALEELTTYHFDHGHGLDCYKVGPSLGCGAPALMQGDKMLLPYCYKDYELLDNGPLRFTVRVAYHPAAYNGEQLTEHRILSLDKGSNFNRQTVWYDGATKPVDIASGVVVHTEDTHSVVLGNNYVQYADPTDNPAAQNFQIYVAVLFPDGVSEVKQVPNEGATNGIAGHALGIVRGVKPGQKVTYYWGSAWSKYDVRTQQAWQQCIDDKLNALHAPLTVEIK